MSVETNVVDWSVEQIKAALYDGIVERDRINNNLKVLTEALLIKAKAAVPCGAVDTSQDGAPKKPE